MVIGIVFGIVISIVCIAIVAMVKETLGWFIDDRIDQRHKDMPFALHNEIITFLQAIQEDKKCQK